MSDTLSLIFELFINLFQATVFIVFCYKFLGPRFFRTLNTICFVAVEIILFLGITFINFFNNWLFGYSETIVYFSIMFTYCLLCLEGKWYMKCLMPTIAFIVQGSISFGIQYFLTAILHKTPTFLNEPNSIYRVIYVIIVNLITVFVLFIIYKIFKNRISLKNFSDLMVFLIQPILTLAVNMLTVAIFMDESTSNLSRLLLSIISISTLTITIFMLNVMVKISKSNEIKTQNMLMKKEQEMYKTETKNINQYIREISKVKHDMKNQVLCISEMIDADKLDEAKNMCSSITSELKSTFEIFNTNNIYLNSILNVISKKSRENGIDLSVNLNSSLKYLDGSDLITVIGNLCDNAIEALMKQDNNRILRLALNQRGGYYIITVKNHIQNSVLESNPDLKSSKNDPIYHGLGLKSVRSIVEKYDGIMRITEEDDMFVAGLMLKIPNVTE